MNEKIFVDRNGCLRLIDSVAPDDRDAAWFLSLKDRFRPKPDISRFRQDVVDAGLLIDPVTRRIVIPEQFIWTKGFGWSSGKEVEKNKL